MKIHELIPTNGLKIFYGKASVHVEDNGTETLYSYHTAIIKRLPDGTLQRVYDGWTQTTGNHIKAFYGLNKAEFTALPLYR